MPLTEEQEQLEYELRIEMMTVTIEKLRSDIAKTHADQRASVRNTFLQCLAIFVAGVAAAAAWFHLH